MSKLGNIKDIYGGTLNIAVANTSSEQILNTTGLPPRTFIIAAPANKDGNDIGACSLIITDNDGVPVRLTYTFKGGNGFYNKNGILSFKTSNKFNSNVLSVNISEIIDNNTFINKNNKITPNDINIKRSTYSDLGLIFIDDYSLKVDNNGLIYVDVNCLTKATNAVFGTAKSDNKTTNISNGKLSVITKELNKATNTSHGIVKCDENTLSMSDGKIVVVTKNLNKSSSSNKGILKPDGKTVISKNGILSGNTNGFPMSDYNSLGILKYDGNSIKENSGEAIVENKMYHIEDVLGKLEYFEHFLSKIESGEMMSYKDRYGYIYYAEFNSTSVFDLEKPIYKESIISMPVQYVYITINIRTSCNFTISSVFSNNINPEAEISEIIYNGKTYVGNECYKTEYESTNNIDKQFIILVKCKNFNGSSLPYTQITDLNITFYHATNINEQTTLTYSIVRYNSFINISNELHSETKASKIYYINSNFMGLYNVQTKHKEDMMKRYEYYINPITNK